MGVCADYYGDPMSKDDRIYKQHYACFTCRKVFKKTNLEEVPTHRQRIDERGRIVHCPQCGERMPDVGFDFEPPKKEDIKGWREAKARLEKSPGHELRNSKIVNVKSRKARTRFQRELDAERGRVYSLTDESKHATRRKGAKSGRT